MSHSPKPEELDPAVDDPDIPTEPPRPSAFAFGDATPIGETDRIVRETAAYDAARHDIEVTRGHAVGGSDGSTEGQ
ncbi:hypothetical protein GYA93_18820 [Gordonia desulfuricans]|uniref:Uncharacterized protein n=1 Tax=Gordonia desulfuricans TaxID=89051 RepID=A0A7K3LTL2_9ACTN|nr:MULTISPECIES: hypothetical protein [Gordonia]EMP11351.1 hypothetical protein ISGA_3692 [Gordonia sp. NB41Y]NDK91614.1 hypothetical protein [Gordonia desulfuricans]WLP89815.1 hypothetical protein Q9K23_20030 [Gordonia sp. NB41Y]